MKKRLNIYVLFAEIACIFLLHSFKTIHPEKTNSSFAGKFLDLNKVHSLRTTYTISSLK